MVECYRVGAGKHEQIHLGWSPIWGASQPINCRVAPSFDAVAFGTGSMKRSAPRKRDII